MIVRESVQRTGAATELCTGSADTSHSADLSCHRAILPYRSAWVLGSLGERHQWHNNAHT